jgi:isopenicillin N synthase-like dioxygenase
VQNVKTILRLTIEFLLPGLYFLVRKNDISNAHLIVKQLDEAFSTVGFVYLTNHGIDQTTVK